MSLKGHAAGIPRRPLKPLSDDMRETILRDLQFKDLLGDVEEYVTELKS